MESFHRQTLHQKVYENLKNMILSGEIMPGTKLNETTVAKEMNTSTTPVREAFRLLESDGFVRMEPWKGIIVEDYDAEEIISAYKCREALEVLGVELTIERLKECSDMEDAVKKIEHEILRTERAIYVQDFSEINSSIDNLWINGSGNRRLKLLMSSLNDVLVRDRNLSSKDEKRKKEIIAEHVAVLNAVKELDVQKAKEALRLHIRNGLEYSLNKIVK